MPINSYMCGTSIQWTKPLFVVAILGMLCGLLAACNQGSRSTTAHGGEEQGNWAGKNSNPKVTNSIAMVLVLVPAGDFLMGAPDTDDLAQKDEKPQHKVRLSQSYYLGAH